VKIFKCVRCEYFEKANWPWFLPMQKLFTGVAGFCMDSLNPDFNEYAKESGRGIPRTKAIFGPEWCRFKDAQSKGRLM